MSAAMGARTSASASARLSASTGPSINASIGACRKALFLCAVSAVLASAPLVSAQTPSKKHIPADPAEVALSNLLASAQAAMDRKDFPAAAQNFQDYLAKKPDDASAHFGLGFAFMSMQKLPEAKGEYEKAISLDPKMAPAYLNLGLTLVDTDPAAAVAPLQKALELSPNQAGSKIPARRRLRKNSPSSRSHRAVPGRGSPRWHRFQHPLRPGPRTPRYRSRQRGGTGVSRRGRHSSGQCRCAPRARAKPGDAEASR